VQQEYVNMQYNFMKVQLQLISGFLLNTQPV